MCLMSPRASIVSLNHLLVTANFFLQRQINGFNWLVGYFTDSFYVRNLKSLKRALTSDLVSDI